METIPEVLYTGNLCLHMGLQHRKVCRYWKGMVINMEQQMQDEDEKARRERRAQKIEEMKRSKEKQQQQREQLKKIVPVAGTVVGIILAICIGSRLFSHKKAEDEPQSEQVVIHTEEEPSSAMHIQEATQTEDNNMEEESAVEEAEKKAYTAQTTSQTAQIGEDVVSTNAIVINEKTGNILAQRAADTRVNPASMTKILTVLVAAEHVKNLDDKFTITFEETDFSYVHDCSNAGFEVDETVTVRDLFYGTILPSGADAAVGLAVYVAGSQEAFVDMMNAKLEELGLADTAHFTNCVGLYDEDHYCTVYDMAMILKAAIDNALCREVMSAHTYNTTPSEQHPEGLLLSNWFLRRIEDKDCGGEVLCAKTGYVVQSGSCAASYALDQDGNGYLCVTANSSSSWRCIYDHVALYQKYLGK